MDKTLLVAAALSLLAGVAAAQAPTVTAPSTDFCAQSVTPCVVYSNALLTTNAGDPRTISATVTDLTVGCDVCDNREVEFIVRKLLNNSQIATGTVNVVTSKVDWLMTIQKSGLYKVEARQCWNYTPPALNTATECSLQDPLRCCSIWVYSTDSSVIAPSGWIWLVTLPPPSGGGIE